MRFGKGIAFLVGFVVAGFASALLVSETSNHPADVRSTRDQQQRIPEARARAAGFTSHALGEVGELALASAPGPLGAVESASRDLFAALASADWPRSQALLVNESDLDHLPPGVTRGSIPALVENQRFMFERLVDWLAGAGSVSFVRVNLVEPPVRRNGQILVEESEWLVDQEGVSLVMRSGPIIGDDQGWRFLELPTIGRPVFLPPEGPDEDPAAALCRENLVQIDAALRMWARATGSPGGTVVLLDELDPFLPHLNGLPVCPSGGEYLGEDGTPAFAVGEIPRCTIGGEHAFP